MASILANLRKKIGLWLTTEPHYKGLPLCDFERIRYELRPCDVILIEGRSRAANVIKQVTNSPWTHSGLYIGRIYDIDDIELRNFISEHFKGEPNDQLII